MEKYLQQLLADIAFASENVAWPYADSPAGIHDWITDEEEDSTAPRRPFEEWTGIQKAQLPADDMLTDEQIHLLFTALKKMLDAFNWMFVTQIEVPERVQYRTLRDNFDQEAIIKRWHMGFFAFCKPGTAQDQCVMGEYCHCKFFSLLFADMIDEELSPEEERLRHLNCEITYLMNRHGSDWMKYYPYHLDPEYDDENGEPYDYDFGSEDENDEEDDWWRK